MSKVRTNIEIEDTYVQVIMDRYGVRTKTEAVDLALRHLAGQPMTREEALAMRGAGSIEQLPHDACPPGGTLSFSTPRLRSTTTPPHVPPSPPPLLPSPSLLPSTTPPYY